ncbi:MAG: hypothetical protein K9G76_06870 [Bacteroidales bacterium]|nr:hypothetical protein [Bacteroidales bacterium]MCF8404300.1 hypothetical protein [Bacteroidales bacterium]
MKSKFILFLLCVAFSGVSQNTSQLVNKESSSYVFGQIYTDFRYCFQDNYQPRAAFNFNQGIIGYRHQLSDKLSGIIMYDVTRTTHFYEITDTAGNPMNYDYFEGSKYTAYLKMAEIKWSINDYLDLRVGQLLNTQYLTFQDKFWGYRFVDVTYQEKYRLGMPADFGAQLDLKIKDKFLNQFSIVNGEGPFRHQDENGKFIFSNNMQYYPTKQITLKLYVDYGASPDTAENRKDKSVISGFAGYKTDKFRIGGEYTYVTNFGYYDKTNYYGYSVYGGVILTEKFQLLARYDHLDMSLPEEDNFLDYYILGFQYEPEKKFTTSVNFRYFSIDKLPFIYFNFGLKF